MNNTDVWVRQGAYGTEEDAAAVSTWRRQGNTLTFPRIQGTDTVGTIAAVGEGVSPDRIGERVMVDFSIYNRDDDSLADIDYMGHGRDGGYAEYQTVPAENAHVVDTEMSDVELATFCCAYLTGEQMLERAGLKAGERVLVTGASGGVGSGIVQLARARGAIPYADRRQGQGTGGARHRRRGCDHPWRRRPAAAVNEATGGQPIDVVADLVGGAIFNDLLRILRPEGRYTTAGAIAGPVVQLDLRTMYLKQLQLHGSSQGTRADFRRIVGYIEAKKIRPLVGGVYRLSDFHQAQADFIAKDFVGKLVVVPDAMWNHPRITARNAPTSERVVNGIDQHLAAWIDVVETQHAVGDVAKSDAGAGKTRAPPSSSKPALEKIARMRRSGNHPDICNRQAATSPAQHLDRQGERQKSETGFTRRKSTCGSISTILAAASRLSRARARY